MYSPSAVDEFVKRCKDEISHVNLNATNKSRNISSAEEKALRKASHSTDFVIKPADKGGALVVWRRDLYVQGAERQLHDTTFYRKESSDLTSRNNDKVRQVLLEEIEEGNLPTNANVLLVKRPRTSKFYL